MDRYQKVKQKKTDVPINENEIRITSQGMVRNYISYATSLLQERHGKEIVLKAMGQAISKTVAIAEGIKRRIPQLHQDTAISSVSITDVWEPIEEGLVPVEMTRRVSMISITLSPKKLDKNSPGYQSPPFVEGPREQYFYHHQQQPRQAHKVYNTVNEEPFGGNYQRSRGRGRGRGQGRGQFGGRGGRVWGWSRGGHVNHQGGGNYENSRDGGGYGSQGGYDNYQGDGYGNYQGNNEFSNWSRGGGQGGNSGYRGGNNYGRGGTGRAAGGRGYGRGRGR